MTKTLKKIIIIVLSAVALFFLVWGGLTLLKNAKRGEVSVFYAGDFATDYMAETAQCSGMVTTDKLQKVYMSPTQNVVQIYVEEGQSVRAGDKLIAFDTTLSDIDLRQAQIALERQQMELENDRNAYNTLMNAKTTEQLEAERAAVKEKLDAAREEAGIPDPDAKPELPEGTGTRLAPFCVLWNEETDSLSSAKLNELLGGRNDAYVLLLTEDDTDFYIYQGLHLVKNVASGEVSVYIISTLEMPEPPEPTLTDKVRQLEKELAEIDELIENSHSKAELIRLQNQKRRDISSQEVDIKIARVELRRLQSEVQDGVIYSELDGVVKVLRDPTEAYNEGSAVLEVSAGGGYYIQGAVSELALDTVSLGQSVEVNSWMTGAYCTGSVVEIGTYPTDNASVWSDGNNNVSYYPMKVYVDGDADLREDDWVDISYTTGGHDENSWYLDNMFIRSEKGMSYVFVRGEDGRLEKRFIGTGGSLWGSYTEIKGGITMEDYLAFPYGKDVEDGAKTREGTIEEFYSW